ncbi:MAG: hypothetical protein NTV32_06875, partial [Gammaproteobacteria bacterium]|nr:hypothetical protein [Gammaproteobacteria bacterium]
GIIKVNRSTIYREIARNSGPAGYFFSQAQELTDAKRKMASSGPLKMTAGRGLIPNRTDIEDRPKIVETKSRIGDIEGDTAGLSKMPGIAVRKATACAKILGLNLSEACSKLWGSRGGSEKIPPPLLSHAGLNYLSLNKARGIGRWHFLF